MKEQISTTTTTEARTAECPYCKRVINVYDDLWHKEGRYQPHSETEAGDSAINRVLCRKSYSMVVRAPAPQPAPDAPEIGVERRNELWEKAQVGGGTDDDLYDRLLAEESERLRMAQPALDAGEWHVKELGGDEGYRLLDQHNAMLLHTHNAELAAQIVSDHRSAAAVPKLKYALSVAREALRTALRDRVQTNGKCDHDASMIPEMHTMSNSSGTGSRCGYC